MRSPLSVLVLVGTTLAGAASTAHAGGTPGSIGVGAETQSIPGLASLLGVGALSVDYDDGKFNAGGQLGLSDTPGPENTAFVLGGRFYYHVASTATTDFGLGGALSLESVPADQPTPTRTRDLNLFLTPGFQIRAFVGSNVALSFTGGIALGVADASGYVVLGGRLTGGAGVHYYF